MLRAFPVRQFRVEQAVDGVDLAGRVFCFNVCSTGSAVFFRSVG